eukprot:4167618-Alexandrium_andersonii.AAC.1
MKSLTFRSASVGATSPALASQSQRHSRRSGGRTGSRRRTRSSRGAGERALARPPSAGPAGA